MASFTVIPYDPIQANANRRPRKDLQVKPSILPADAPQPQAIAVADNAGGLTTREKDNGSISDGDQGSHDSVCAGAPFFIGRSEEVSGAENNDIQIELGSFDETDDTVGTKNGFMTEVDKIFAKVNAESKASGAEVQDGDAEFGASDIESGMRGIRHLLKRKPKTGGQGSKDNPLVIPDSGSESDSESEDGLVWGKRREGHSLVGHQVPCLRTIDETDDEADDTKFGIGRTKVRAGDAQSKNDGIASEIEDFASTSTGLVRPQSVARVGGNGEWGIHGIIGKEVIGGKVYYCVDWEPTMMPIDDLLGAERLVRKFETKKQARRGKRGDTQKRKRSLHRKQPF